MDMFGTVTTMASVIGVIYVVLLFVVPLLIIWLLVRYLTNKTNKRAEIVTALVEKNPDVDIEEFLKKLSPKKRLLKEKLLAKLHVGCVLSFGGIALLGFAVFVDYRGGIVTSDLIIVYLLGIILLAMGIAFFINYFVGKKMLAKEIEAEESKFIEK